MTLKYLLLGVDIFLILKPQLPLLGSYFLTAQEVEIAETWMNLGKDVSCPGFDLGQPKCHKTYG